jgi:DNA-binding transcriptional regulator GbsR (MarR family)
VTQAEEYVADPATERAVLLRFVERFALVLRESGMQPMPARVFAYALADDADRYTAAELADGLQVSPAAISGAVRQLVQIGFLVREREPGTRSDLYVLDDDNLWTRFFASQLGVLRTYEDTVTAGLEVLGESSPGGRRLAETRAFFAFLREEMGALMARWPEEKARRTGHPTAEPT